MTPGAAEQIAGAQDLYASGRIEQTLRGLGVTDIDFLRRGGDIDRAPEQLIIQAAAERESEPVDPSMLLARVVRGVRRPETSVERRGGVERVRFMLTDAQGAQAEP